MPLIVPPFVQYQAPLVPLRGLWNVSPPEGDKFVNAEIDWGVTTNNQSAVQFSLSGNSPVALSQIAALSVDNTRCGADVQFLFPDSGSELTVPGYTQGIYPVFTNALMFYVVASGSVAGDTTVFAVHNSIPPPLAIQSTETQEHAAVSGANLTNGTTALIPSTVSGTVETISGTIIADGAGVAAMSLTDGTGAVLWYGSVQTIAGQNAVSPVSVGPIRVRFIRGLNLNVSGSTYPAGSAWINLNVYYGVP